MTADKSWVVWYEHWRFHEGTVDIRECDTREDAYETASYLEFEAEDCVNHIIGIEGPDGFIDLAEYESIKNELDDARFKRWRKAKDDEAAQHKRTIIVSGPDGHNYSETWTDPYFNRYYQKLLDRFGADRVSVAEGYGR